MSRPRSKDLDLAKFPRLRRRVGARTTWYYYRHTSGKQTPLGTDFQAAVQRYWQIEDVPAAVMNFAAIVERYLAEYAPDLAVKTQKLYRLCFKRLVPVFGKALLSDIKPHILAQYRDKRSSKSMANRELTALFSMWAWAREQGYIETPAPTIARAKEKPKRDYVTDEQLRAVQAHLSPEMVDLLDLLYLTGQDVGVVLGWKRTDIIEGFLHSTRKKTDAPLRIRVEGEFAAVLERALARPRTATGPYIVQDDRGQRLTYAVAWNRFEKARKLAGATWALRRLRSKTATDAETPQHANELLAHQSMSTTKRVYRKGPKVRPLK